MRFPFRSILPRGRSLKFWILVLLIGPPLVLLLLFVASSFLKIDLSIDLAKIAIAAAIVICALVAYQLFQTYFRPRQTVSVGFNYRLVQPALPLGRYSFRLEIFYEFEEKGERQRVEQGTIEMKFRRKNHPEVLDWCCGQITEHLTRHAHTAARRYPRAEVLMPPEPTPQLMAVRVEVESDSSVHVAQEGTPLPPGSTTAD